MMMKVYSICDIKAEEYGPLFLAKNDEIAFRMCKAQFKDVEYPQDYQLDCVGYFDTEKGCLDGTFINVCNLADLFSKEFSE